MTTNLDLHCSHVTNAVFFFIVNDMALIRAHVPSKHSL